MGQMCHVTIGRGEDMDNLEILCMYQVHVDDIVKGLDKAFFWDAGEYKMGSGIATNLLQLAENKTVFFKEARREAKESVLDNTTPNWEPEIDVFKYINS